MGIISIYIISKAGGLIFSHDMPHQSRELEVEFHQFPVEGLVLEEVDRNIMVKFGEVNTISGRFIQGVEDHGNDKVHRFNLSLASQTHPAAGEGRVW